VDALRAVAPDWLIGVAALVLATAAALLAHYSLLQVSYRLVGARDTAFGQLISRTRGPTRLALVILGLSLVVAWAPLEAGPAATINRLLTIAFIILLGWTALTIVGLMAELYLARFRVGGAESPVARKHLTQVRILERAADTLIVVVTAGATLMTFEAVRQFGVSLFASAGLVSIVVGLAARPVLSNLIAGIQIAMTQPIRLEDAVVVEAEFGWVEEITSTYVVLRLWDRRRMIVPISYFIEKPFQNWTRQSTEMIGSVMFYLDYAAPVARIRQKLNEIVAQSPLWDHQVVSLQVVDTKESAMQLQALVSAKSSGAVADLKAELREKLIAFLQQEHPEALPKQRAQVDLTLEARAELATSAFTPAAKPESVSSDEHPNRRP
jgi:small-conductance mechanosensitive channel